MNKCINAQMLSTFMIFSVQAEVADHKKRKPFYLVLMPNKNKMQCIQCRGLRMEVVGTLALWGEAKRWGWFQPGAGVALGAPDSRLPDACRKVIKEMELCVVGGRTTTGVN